MMKIARVIPALLLAGFAAPALANSQFLLPTSYTIPTLGGVAPPSVGALSGGVPTPGQVTFAPHGPIVVTGHAGNFATTTLPAGVPGQGLLISNGNGTSTLIAPGGATVVPTPR
jgi:hypothetical protein